MHPMLDDPINIKVGKLGEQIAADYLIHKGFNVVDRNYRKKSGELDIVARKNGVIHFIEVKTVSRENLKSENNITYRPEDNIHQWKVERLKRAILIYIRDRLHGKKFKWQFDIVTLEIDQINKIAKIDFLKDIII